MSIIDGCNSKFKTPVPEERSCPKCGQDVEVFTLRGRITEDTKCNCGFVFEQQEPDSPLVEEKK